MGWILREISEQWTRLSIGLSDLPSKAVEVLRNPGEDPLLAVIILALALAFLFLLSAFIELALAFIFPSGRRYPSAQAGAETMADAPERGGSARHKLSPAERWLIACLAITSVLGASLYGVSRPSFCSSCHEMARAYKTWRQSPHDQVNCLACHQKTGLLGYAMGKIGLLRMVVSKATRGYRTPIRADIEEGECQSCHAAIYTRKIVSKSIRVSHMEFLRAGYVCNDCHETIGHGARPGANRPTMDKCASCHDGRRAAANCSLCHAYDVGASSRRPADDFPKIELQSGNCRGCHDIAKCTACHGVEMPHPSGWSSGGHAKAAAFEKKAICKKCHSESFCGACHSFPGHPADWKNGHKTDRSAEKACMSCHLPEKSPVFCGLCHDDKEVLKAPGR